MSQDYGELLKVSDPAVAAELRRLWDAVRRIFLLLESLKQRIEKLENV